MTEEEKKIKDKIRRDKWRENNPEKCREHCRNWRKNNPERAKEVQRLSRLKNGDKLRARERELYAQNREHILERKKAWALANPEKVKAIKAKTRSNSAYREKENEGHRAWCAANKDRVRDYNAEYRQQPEVKERRIKWQKEWHKKHPEAQRTYEQNRRARKKGIEGSYTKEDVARLFFKQNGKCSYCKAKLDKYHIDHLIPLALGGTNNKENIQLLCPSCNMQKSSKHPDLFLRERKIKL